MQGCHLPPSSPPAPTSLPPPHTPTGQEVHQVFERRAPGQKSPGHRGVYNRGEQLVRVTSAFEFVCLLKALTWGFVLQCVFVLHCTFASHAVDLYYMLLICITFCMCIALGNLYYIVHLYYILYWHRNVCLYYIDNLYYIL